MTIILETATAEEEKSFLESLSLSLAKPLRLTEGDQQWMLHREDADAITVSVLDSLGWIELTSSPGEPTLMVRDVHYFRGYIADWGWLVDENSSEVHPIVMDEDMDFWSRTDWMWQLAVQYPDQVVVTQTNLLLDNLHDYIEMDDNDQTNSKRLVELTQTLNFLMENNLVEVSRVPPANRNIVPGDPDYVWKFLVKNPTKIHRDWLSARGLTFVRGFQCWVLAEIHPHSIPYSKDWESIYELPVRMEDLDDVSRMDALELLGRANNMQQSIVLADGETIIERPSFENELREITVSSFEDWIICRGCIDWEVDEKLASLIDIQLKTEVSS